MHARVHNTARGSLRFLRLLIGATVELIESAAAAPLSQLLIQHYLNDLQTLRRVSGTSRESVVREAFKTLLGE